MFEQELEDMTATVFFEHKDVSVLDQAGVAVFQYGSRKLDYAEAAALVEKMKHCMAGVPKRLLPRYRACMNSIRFAFGPEFCERH